MARALSAAVMPLENRRDQFVLLATLADELGYEGVMFPETWSYDITVLLAEIAVKTRRVRLGTGILGVWNRSAAVETPPIQIGGCGVCSGLGSAPASAMR